MVKPYSVDLRNRVVSAVAAGQSCRAVADTFGVSVASVVKWSQRQRQTGSVAPGKIGGHKPLKLEAERGIRVGHVAVWNLLRSENLSHKKSVLASEQNRPDIIRKRMRWRRYQASVDPTRLVFIDETWAKTNMAPLRGWSKRGTRLRDQVPYGKWVTLTFVAGLSCTPLGATCLLIKQNSGLFVLLPPSSSADD